MAKTATAPPPPKPPSSNIPGADAGDDNYWNQGGPNPGKVHPEIAPQRVAEKPLRQVPASEFAPAKDAKAKELFDWLQATGLTEELLEGPRAWLRHQPDADCVAGFKALEDREPPYQPNTILRAGKWIWGEDWTPQYAVLKAPNEQIKELRDQLKVLKGHAQSKQAELTGLNGQVAYLTKLCKEQELQNAYLKAGKSAAELAGLPPLSAPERYQVVG